MPEWLKRLTKTDIRNSLAIIIVLGCFALMYVMQVKPIPAENKDVVNIVCGFVFGGALAGVVGFYFGATKGDRPTKDSE